MAPNSWTVGDLTCFQLSLIDSSNTQYGEYRKVLCEKHFVLHYFSIGFPFQFWTKIKYTTNLVNSIQDQLRFYFKFLSVFKHRLAFGFF